MQIDMPKDAWTVLWRHLDRQPMTEDDRAALEGITADIREVVFNPQAEVSSELLKKRGRPSGSRNKAKEIDLTAEYLATTPQQNEQRWTSPDDGGAA